MVEQVFYYLYAAVLIHVPMNDSFNEQVLKPVARALGSTSYFPVMPEPPLLVRSTVFHRLVRDGYAHPREVTTNIWELLHKTRHREPLNITRFGIPVKEIERYYRFSNDFTCELTKQAQSHPFAHKRRELKEVIGYIRRHHEWAWYDLYYAHCSMPDHVSVELWYENWFNLTNMRDHIHSLRLRIGDEAFFAGVMPEPVPDWAFPYRR